MNIGLVFISPNGTTLKTTELMKNDFEKQQHKVKTINIGCEPYRNATDKVLEELKTFDIVGFGSPVYQMNVFQSMKQLFDDLSESDDNFQFKAFIYLNYNGITTGKAFTNTVKLLLDQKIGIMGGVKIKAPHFHHHDPFPTVEAKQIINTFCRELHMKNFSEIDPDKGRKLFKPEKVRVNLFYPFAQIIGKKRQLKIVIDEKSCKGCGKCALECPANAIKIDGIAKIDFNACLHCYHCVVSCPFQAVLCQTDKLDKMIQVNKKIVGIEQPVNKIYM